VILDTETNRRLRTLAPQVLFHGTRTMAAILRDDELGSPVDLTRSIYFSADPEVAAYWAGIARDYDEGRGGIIAVDRSKLAASFALSSEDCGPDDAMYSADAIVEAPLEGLSQYIVATFWADELAPGHGLWALPRRYGEEEALAISLQRVVREFRDLRAGGATMSPDAYDERYWDIVGRLDTWLGCRR
jgi:hypothetical protein